jgi:hypothetical protein
VTYIQIIVEKIEVQHKGYVGQVMKSREEFYGVAGPFCAGYGCVGFPGSQQRDWNYKFV